MTLPRLCHLLIRQSKLPVEVHVYLKNSLLCMRTLCAASLRISEGISLPFKIFPLLQERSPTRMECVILLKALFEKNIAATNVEVTHLLRAVPAE